MTLVRRRPLVALGMPVYNGSRHLEAAVTSIRDQTVGDFTLLISDNGSTDGTGELAERLASGDPRIRVVRHPTNRGATWNFEHVLRASDPGVPYFKWAAHDDVLSPVFLERTVEALESAPDAVLAFGGVVEIDDSGAPTQLKWKQIRAPGPDPVRRFRMFAANVHWNSEAIFGLIRRPVLAELPTEMGYGAADKALLCRLALRGRFIEVPEIIFRNRDHPTRSVRSSDLWGRSAWFRPTEGPVRLPTVTFTVDVVRSVAEAPLPARTRLRCLLHLPRFAWSLRRDLGTELTRAAVAPLRRRRVRET